MNVVVNGVQFTVEDDKLNKLSEHTRNKISWADAAFMKFAAVLCAGLPALPRHSSIEPIPKTTVTNSLLVVLLSPLSYISFLDRNLDGKFDAGSLTSVALVPAANVACTAHQN